MDHSLVCVVGHFPCPLHPLEVHKGPQDDRRGGVVVYGVTHNVPIVMMHCVVTQLFHYIILYMADGARWLTGAI